MGAKAWLSQAGIPFTYHDVTEDAEARDRWLELSDGGNPTILVNGRIVMAGGVFTPSVFDGVVPEGKRREPADH
ncbi:MAG: hypothetical protein M0Z54_10770 [Thermaerobacter sp.]|nr:hypothetical protein [Thermaerobacter sp.]